MFPTFISILDIQSWWEVPSIAHFCSLFRTAFNLLDFDIEDLEEALLTDGTEETSWLQELIVRLLAGCLANNEISTSNYQMFLRRLFRQKCQEHDQYNPFNTDVDFQILPLRTKVDILHNLCDFRLDADDVLEQLKNLEADSLRVEPLGYDSNESAYWYFYGTRLYREDFKTKNNKKKSVWQVICFTEADWFQLNKKFKKSPAKCERQLYRTISENFLPELPRLFREKERLARKRLLENLPRRTSKRLKKSDGEKEEVSNKLNEKLEQKVKRQDCDVKRKEAYERKHSEGSESEKSENRYEMAGNKARQKKTKGRQRKISNSSTNSRDGGSRNSKRKKPNESDKSSAASTTTTVGRQTNNSLAAATGQIVIQSVATTHKKKLKTSQVFQQSDEDLLTGMHKILDFVKNHEDAWPFTDPVDEDYAPNYYTVIRKPMDLQTMDERLDTGYYKNFTKFREDFKLIVDNCRLYNGAENEYTEMVDNLLKVFESATEKILDQISSSDDEIAVEYPATDVELKEVKKKPDAKMSKRKPTLAAKTDKKIENSLSEESLSKQSLSCDSFNDEMNASSKKEKKVKPAKKEEKKPVKEVKKPKKEKSKSPSRSRSRSRSSLFRSYSSSPPPSSAPSSPDNRFNYAPKKSNEKEKEKENNTKSKQKQKVEKLKDDVTSCDSQQDDKRSKSPKPKDKHNKLRETIEKLKAKSELSSKITDFDLDTPKENKERGKKEEKKPQKVKSAKKDPDYDDSSSSESLPNPKKNAKEVKNAKYDALNIATEQTLKDINKWLDDTPKFSEFSSASNSPSYMAFDEFDLGGKPDERKKIEKPVRKDNKDIKRRSYSRDPGKFLKRREVQRTIDRLQPGKSKGNLISNVQSTKPDEIFPLGAIAKNKDTKNALIVKTDDNAPKLSLGSVLDSFGRHKFVDDAPKTEPEDIKPEEIVVQSTEVNKETLEEIENKIKGDNGKKEELLKAESSMMSGATPNLSAWFKAFGAPKVTPTKKPELKPEVKEEKEPPPVPVEAPVKPPEPSPSVEPPAQGAQPVPRQRKVSTGSSISERSSFSQDMDSPRVGIDERLGAYPAPYPSPLHRSPSGASVIASPRPDVSPKSAPYPPFNGQIRVGFYQDTVSNKSSPDKSHSPRDTPSEYTPNSTQSVPPYSYPNSPYYSHAPNYTNTNAVPAYNAESGPNQGFYDTNKSLTEQYQAKNYTAPNAPVEPFRQEEPKEKMPTNAAMFPVKKRIYNEMESVQIEDPMQVPTFRQNIPEKAVSEQEATPILNYSSNPYNYNEGNYPIARNLPERKLDLKYSNVGYNENFQRNLQYQAPQAEQYMNYKNMDMNSNSQAHNYSNNSPRLDMQNSYKSAEVSIPRPTYNSHIEMDQPLGLRGNLTNLSHIVDRYNNDERMLSTLQSAGGQYYGDKGLGGPHMFNKAIGASAGLSMFNQGGVDIQGYNQNAAYNRQINDIQNTAVVNNDGKSAGGLSQSGDKKAKKRKSAKTAASASPSEAPPPSNTQGFQSYAGLKSNAMEPSAISLKTASVVPGSAFNFGPPPSALGLGSGLYTDKDSYPNFLEDFRAAAPNYYITAHHRPEAGDKQPRMAAHQAAAATRQPPPAYPPFMGARQATPPSYPLSSHFMPPTQAPLMDASAPLYQHYLQQAGVLNQGLLGPPAPYPPGYHPALSMRQPYDSMTRPPWL